MERDSSPFLPHSARRRCKRCRSSADSYIRRECENSLVLPYFVSIEITLPLFSWRKLPTMLSACKHGTIPEESCKNAQFPLGIPLIYPRIPQVISDTLLAPPVTRFLPLHSYSLANRVTKIFILQCCLHSSMCEITNSLDFN